MADYNSAYTGAQIDANLALAATAVQDADLATVATTGAYSDLTGKPTLGTAAATASTDYATAAQGALADTAVQPADDAADLGSGAATDGYVLTADGAGGAAWEAGGGGSSVTDYLRTRLGTVQDVFNMADTWNASGTTFTGIKLNVTDTASAAGSLLMDLQVGGVSRFSVGKGAGAIFATNLIEQRNGVNAQAFNLYNTYTDASNYERGFMRFVSNMCEIGTAALGTGTTREVKITGGTNSNNIILGNNGIFLSNGGTNQWYLNNSGDFYTIVDNLRDLGGAASNRPRNINAATSVNAPRVQVNAGFTVATLPTPATVGMMARVTDATTPTVGSTVTGGGAAAALCWYNGTNWTVIGV